MWYVLTFILGSLNGLIIGIPLYALAQMRDKDFQQFKKDQIRRRLSKGMGPPFEDGK